MADKKATPSQSILFEYHTVVTAAVAVLIFVGLAYLYLAHLSALIRWGAAIILLIGSGEFIARINKRPSFIGMYMLGGTRGITLVDNLSKKNTGFWKFMADWGLVLGFGLLSYPLFKDYVSKKAYVTGIATILVILFLVYPYLGLTLSFLNLPQITSRIPTPPPGTTFQYSLTPVGGAIYGLAVVGGFTLFTIAGIAYNGFSVLYTTVVTSYQVVVQHVVNTTALSEQIPGIAPLIPGITIPLFAGILALALILIIHEFSHGVLARIAKIKIRQIGLVLFGIIPAGAFVEPNEAAVKKLSERDQNRIFIAGVSSNMLAALFFFVLFVIFYFYIIPPAIMLTSKVIVVATVANSPASGVIPLNSTILAWNNYPIKNVSSFKVATINDTPYANISILTNKGLFRLRANATGKVGVYVEEVVSQTPRTPGNGYKIVNFIYEFISLSFLLNFLVGIVNMLPLPGLDGWRIYKTKLKDSRWLGAIVAFIIFLILLNLIPWLFV